MPVHVPPTAADGRVFVITVENQLRALSAADGSDVWPPYQALGEVARLLGGASPAVSRPVRGGAVLVRRTGGAADRHRALAVGGFAGAGAADR